MKKNKPHMNNMVEVEHGLSEEELDVVEAVAAAEGLSVAELLHRVIAEGASEHRGARRAELARARLEFTKLPRWRIWGL